MAGGGDFHDNPSVDHEGRDPAAQGETHQWANFGADPVKEVASTYWWMNREADSAKKAGAAHRRLESNTNRTREQGVAQEMVDEASGDARMRPATQGPREEVLNLGDAEERAGAKQGDVIQKDTAKKQMFSKETVPAEECCVGAHRRQIVAFEARVEEDAERTEM